MRGVGLGLLFASLAAAGCEEEHSCFVTGTSIATPQGPRRIEALKIGDQVWSYDPQVGRVPRAVQHIHRALVRTVCRVEAGGKTIRGVTPTHPMYDAAEATYTPLRDFTETSALLLVEEQRVQRTSIDSLHVEEAPEPVFDVFSLSVEGPEHNYIADGVLVHNKSLPPPEPVGVCGDGYVDYNWEACDDGNRIDGDHCSNSCFPVEVVPGRRCCCTELEVAVPDHCFQRIDIPDPVLERVLRAAVARPEGELVHGNVSSLRVLRVEDEAITDLTGLECFTGLLIVELSNGLVTNLTPLSGLERLVHLHLGNQQIADLSPLSDLCGIDRLMLPRNQIVDLAPLSSLASLTYLNLEKNRITELVPLSAATGLEQLLLAGNRIADTTGLSQSITTTLDLSQNPLSNLAPLTQMTGLQYLYLDEVGLSDLSALATLRGVRVLTAKNNSISDLSFLAAWNAEAWSELVLLQLQDNDISDLSPLLPHPGLGVQVRIELEGNPIDCDAQAENFTELFPRFDFTGCLR